MDLFDLLLYKGLTQTEVLRPNGVDLFDLLLYKGVVGSNGGVDIPIGVNLFNPDGQDVIQSKYIDRNSVNGQAPIWMSTNSYNTHYFPYDSDYSFTMTNFYVGSTYRVFAVDSDGNVCGSDTNVNRFKATVKTAEANLGRKAVGAYLTYVKTRTDCVYIRTA